MPRNPALSEAINLVNAKIAECNTILRDATYALDNAESALSALGTAALIVDVRAQRDRWDAIAGELRRLVGDDAPTLPAGEQGKVCPKCGGTGHTGERIGTTNTARACRPCNGTGAVIEIDDDCNLYASSKPCPTCRGRGNFPIHNDVKPCQSCGGSGYVEIR